MKRFLLFVFFVASILTARIALSCDFQIINEFELGQQPVRILYDPDNDLYHAFCNGNDINYDGDFDEDLGEELPSWWTFSLSESHEINYQKVMNFEAGFFPHTFFYPGIDLNDRKLYVPFSPKYDENFNITEQGKVSVYDLDDHSLIQDELISLNPTSVTVMKDVVFVTGQDDDMTDMVYALDKYSYDIIDQIQVGPEVQQLSAIDDPNGWIIGILNEGFFGQNNSTLSTTRFIEGKFGEVNNIDLGDTGHFLLPIGSGFGAVINGSHEVKLISDSEIYKEIKLSSTGYDGPRELAYHRYLFIVTSYNGTISFYEQHGNEYDAMQNIELEGKADALLYINDLVFVCLPLDESYQKLKKVYVLQDKFLSVNSSDDNSMNVYPNPASSVLNINQDLQGFSGSIRINIASLHGNIMYQETLDITNKLQLQINLTNFPQGVYCLKLNYGNEVGVVNFNVIR